MRIRFLKLARVALALTVAVPALYAAGGVQSAYAQAVSRIIVEGNQRVEDEAVKAYLQFGPGDVITDQALDESLKALFQTGLFADVQLFRRGSAVVVQVEENPLINRVAFEGNDELDDKKLGEETELRERSILTRARVQSDTQRIIALYRRSGYYNVSVEPKIIRLPQNRVNLVYEINEGKATRIESIRFVGNEAFSDGQLRSVITTAESAWWKFFSTSDNYDPDRLAYDQELLRRHYLQHGYADFRVISANAELAPDGENFFITFTVEEGPQYAVSAVSVNTGETTLDPDQLQGALKTRTGETYDASEVDKSIENITIEAGKAGFAFARVQPDIQRDEATRTLSIVYNIQEGPRVYIERIDIVGNTRTLDEVIRRELRLVEGDAYNRILVDRARRNLTALDFFEKIDIREDPGSSPDKVVLVIDVEEKSTGTINFSAGYSTVEQVIGSVSVSERNLLGRGQFVRLNTSLSFKRQSVDFSFTEPYFLDRKLSAGVDAYAARSESTSDFSFDTLQYGGGPRLGFTLDEQQSITTRYNFTHRQNKFDRSDPDVSPAVKASAGKDNISLLGLDYVYDDLDNPLKPTSGFRFEASGDFAGLGGNIQYFKGELRGYYFQPLFYDGVVLKLKGTAGHIEGWGGEDVEVTDRFFRGGDTFRGFERGGVGPQQRAPSGRLDSIGGQTYAIGTLEVSFPLGLPESFGITGAVFTDFGTVFNAPDSTLASGAGTCVLPAGVAGVPATCTVFDNAAFRASVGAGVIWESPFGPLRLDVAYPIAKANFDKKELVRFSVGTRF